MYKQIARLASEDVHEVIDNECKDYHASDKMMSSLCHESATQLNTFFGSIDAPKRPHSQITEVPNILLIIVY